MAPPRSTTREQSPDSPPPRRRTDRRPYSRHGLNALKSRVKVRGLNAIDRRTAVARALIAWRNELIVDLGGDSCVSAQLRALVDLATRTKLYLDSLDAWLMEQPSLVNARRRAVLPIVRERQQLADALSRYLQALGLERRAKPGLSLNEYLHSKYGAGTDGREDATGGEKVA
jgi:hypothetical protein